MELIPFIGRFHLVVLHLPIGLMVALVLLELTSFSGRRPSPEIWRYRRAAAIVFALTALIAACTGLLLRAADGGSGEWLDRHMWLGLLAAGLSVVYAVFASLRPPERPTGFSFAGFVRTGLVFVLAGVISAAGHFGGELTHGRGFLTQYAPQSLKTWLGMEPSAVLQVSTKTAPTVYEQIVRPMLQTHCTGCHGQDKRKGNLALHTPEMILTGGKGGLAVVPGVPAESRLIQRITLPPDHEEHMPPRGKTPLSHEQIEALRWWIAQGADFECGIEAIPTGVQKLIVRDEPAKRHSSPISDTLDLAVIAALQDQQITVQRISQKSDLLWVEFSSYPDKVTDDVVQKLHPIAPFIAWLDLSDTAITDVSMSLLSQMSALEDLNLRRTRISTDVLGKLAALDHLKRLNLSEVKLNDEIVETFLSMAQLKRLYLWGSGLSPQSVEKLRAPRIHVVTNEAAAPQILLEETEKQ